MKKILILITLGFLIYGISAFNGFVWDDEVFLQQNPAVTRDSQSISKQSYFRPVMAALNELYFIVFGPQPGLRHVLQVVAHLAAAVLIFLLLRRFIKEHIAFFLSLVFLAHPVNVEAVCFASAMQEVLFTLTGVGGVYVLVRSKNISPIAVLSSLSLVTLALLMKETAIVFFFLIFVYLILFHRKNSSAASLFAAFAIIVVATYVLARFSVGNVYVLDKGLFPIMREPLSVRLMNIPMIIFYYLSKIVFPFHLGIAQHWVVRSVNLTQFYLPLMVEIALFLSAMIYIVKSKSKTFMFFFLWFLLGLLPHLQIVPLNMTVAERWMYFPLIGVLGMAGSLTDSLKLTAESRTFKVLLFCIIILFSLRSFIRVLDWRSGLSLFTHDVNATSSFDLQNNAGVELFRIGKYAQAKKYFENSTRLAPYWWVNWNNLGAVYEQEKNFSEAEKLYRKSMQNGTYHLAYENLAKILIFHGPDKQEAYAFLEKARQLFPESETLELLEQYRQQQMSKGK